MDALKEIKRKLKASPHISDRSGLESVIRHIELAERHHFRAKAERDEHLYTDVIYRTNHAFEGILKEAYVVLEGGVADNKTPYEIEEYLLANDVLRGRVVALFTNYRQDWRNPSTHDYRLFFSEEESFLAIMTVTAFVSVLMDRIIDRAAYQDKYVELQTAAALARERMPEFDALTPIDRVYKVLLSYSSYFMKNYESMSKKSRSTANAEMAAFLKRVAPEFDVDVEPEVRKAGKTIRLDMMVTVGKTKVAIETHDPKPEFYELEDTGDPAATVQMAERLRLAGLKNGVVFFYPGSGEDVEVATTSSSTWPKGLNLREVYSADPALFGDVIEQAVDLVE